MNKKYSDWLKIGAVLTIATAGLVYRINREFRPISSPTTIERFVLPDYIDFAIDTSTGENKRVLIIELPDRTRRVYESTGNDNRYKLSPSTSTNKLEKISLE